LCRRIQSSRGTGAAGSATLLNGTRERMMGKDRIYGEPKKTIDPFRFDETVVGVFDDMLVRSIPLYRETIRRQVQLIDRYYRKGSRIYDLGCSNGNLGIGVCKAMARLPFHMIAVDNSAPMLRAYAERLKTVAHHGRVDLRCDDIRDVDMRQASVTVLNFTLQFIDRHCRTAIVERIHDGLLPGGILLFCEKLDHLYPEMAGLQQEMYYGFKKENGYSELEISQKREALEAVLVPEPLEAHLDRLTRAGFPRVDVWLKWFNFAALIAVK
jgi:tRNA (cmo5U34)-methyltransferase